MIIRDTKHDLEDAATAFMEDAANNLRAAFQPVVDIRTGRTVGHESLVRGIDRLGIPHPSVLFDKAAEKGCLVGLEVLLLQRSFARNAGLPKSHDQILFVNMDERLLGSWVEVRREMLKTLEAHGIAPHDICVELNVGLEPLEIGRYSDAIDGLREPGFQIAIDDFGTGRSSLQMLHQTCPDFLKIDRFFIRSMTTDPKKRLLVRSIVALAHTLGARVIAEGVENEAELMACREAGCDLAQGFLIARPTLLPQELQTVYQLPAPADEHTPEGASKSVLEASKDVMILSESDEMDTLIELIGRGTDQTVFPVIAANGKPRGAVRERDVRQFVLSAYGRALCNNPGIRLPVTNYMRPIATIEAGTDIGPWLDRIAEHDVDGAIVTREGRFAGFLSLVSLLRLSNQVRLNEAKSRNPLTGLPGNESVAAFFDKVVEETGEIRSVAYIDLDNFKAFNDKLGFSEGDRAIGLMADILKAKQRDYGVFVGHVGGDDFVMGAIGPGANAMQNLLERVRNSFREAAEVFYSPSEREAGCFVGTTRDGKEEELPLLASTTVALNIAADGMVGDAQELSERLAALKGTARRIGEPFLSETLGSEEEKLAG